MPTAADALHVPAAARIAAGRCEPPRHGGVLHAAVQPQPGAADGGHPPGEHIPLPVRYALRIHRVPCTEVGLYSRSLIRHVYIGCVSYREGFGVIVCSHSPRRCRRSRRRRRSSRPPPSERGVSPRIPPGPRVFPSARAIVRKKHPQNTSEMLSTPWDLPVFEIAWRFCVLAGRPVDLANPQFAAQLSSYMRVCTSYPFNTGHLPLGCHCNPVTQG